MNRLGSAALAAALLVVLLAGCTGGPSTQPQSGPFSIAIFATTDTRGELEPCG